MAELLSITGLTVGYGSAPVLTGLTLRSGAARRVGLFGPNGHGKTTLLKTISGLLKPAAGRICFDGEEIAGRSPKRIVEAGIVHVAQGSTLFPAMTVGECLALGAFLPRCRAMAGENLERVYALFPRLAERRDQPCRTLSGGERQMVAIGIGLMGAPKLLMLDEPTLGLSPKLKEELRAAIDAVTAGGIPVVVVEQDIEFLLSLTDTLFMVNHGEVVLEMNADNRLDHAGIMELYFGSEAHA